MVTITTTTIRRTITTTTIIIRKTTTTTTSATTTTTTEWFYLLKEFVLQKNNNFKRCLLIIRNHSLTYPALKVNEYYQTNPKAQTKLISDLLATYHESVPPTHEGPVQVELGFTMAYFDFLVSTLAIFLSKAKRPFKLAIHRIHLSWSRQSQMKLEPIPTFQSLHLSSPLKENHHQLTLFSK